MREIQTREEQIGDFVYRITPLGVGEGKALLMRLIRIIGPGIASVIDKVNPSEGNLASVQVSELAPTIREIVNNLYDEDLDYAIKVLSEKTLVKEKEGKSLTELSGCMDSIFPGAYDEMYQWLVLSLEVNYGSFFSALKEKAKSSPELQATDPSKSQNT